MVKNVVIGVLVVLLLVVGGLWLGQPKVSPLGVTIGTNQYNPVSFSNTVTISGAATLSGVNTLSGESHIKAVETGNITTLTKNATTVTITAAQVCDSNVIEWAPGTSASATLPTAAAMYADCLTANGDHISFLFRDISATSTNTVVLKAAASTTLLGATNADELVAITSSNLVDFFRASVDEMVVTVENMIDAD
jgi:hypothetical protein